MITGRTIAGKYQITELLRRETYYDVYIARVAGSETRVILKWYRSELIERGKTFERIKSWMDDISKLNHPRVAPLRDFGEDESIYITEDFYDGAPLADVLGKTKGNGINALRALNLGIKIVEGMSVAHLKGVVHGQFSPRSVIVAGDLNPKVVDFFILHRLSSELKTSAEFQGRDIRYCAPEVISGGKPDFRSDVYSIGATLYELLTGKQPFDTANALSIALDKVSCELKSPRACNPEVPKLLEAVVIKCIKRDPESRYKNATDLLNELYLCRTAIVREANAEKNAAQDVDGAPAASATSQGEATLGRVAQSNMAKAGGAPDASAALNDQSTVQSRAASDSSDISTKDSESGESETSVGGQAMGTKRQLPKGFTAFAVSLGVLLAIVIILAKIASNFFGGNPAASSVVIPNVIGKSVLEAKSVLGAKGLVAVISGKQNSEEIPRGYIMKQTPESGARVRKDREIELIVSSGQHRAVVPKLEGLTIEDARLILEKAQLTVGDIVSEYSEQYGEGFVTGQTPEAGEERYAGSAVNIRLSSGRMGKLYGMPPVTNMAIEDARALLEMNDIRNIETKHIDTSYAGDGRVAAQSVLEGTKIPANQKVTLYYARQPERSSLNSVLDDPTKGVVNIKISSENESQEVVVMVYDRSNAREAYRAFHGPGDVAQVPVSGYGKLHVLVYINGILITEQTL
ncbi:MAG TPA: PASTA domain-containing protein [bacterium]|nr:PASTA domain-containing protein [bacterium]